MCTLISIHRTVPGRWLVVAANRDEYLDRPSEPPALRSGQGLPLIAPMDMRAGGSWIGLNKKGVFSALTNLRDPNPDPGRQSRGQVVMDCLARESAADAVEGLMAIEARAHNPFNVYVADRDQAFLVVYREEPFTEELAPGVHVVGNVDPRECGRGTGSKVDRVREQVEGIVTQGKIEIVDALGELCGSHGSQNSSLDDLCVHVGDTYGTRSSILLELSEASFESSNGNHQGITGGGGSQTNTEGGEGGRFLYAEGPPCVAPFKDYSILLEELRRTPGYAPAVFS
ncbi:MAG: NRDE family protein [Myxococcota bacterium]|nr:NRDE family protein [Myxococcota bacterium]